MHENALNASAIDTSSFRAEDFALFMDCLENIEPSNATADKAKKTRESRSRAYRAKDGDAAAALKQITGYDAGGNGKRWAPSYFSSCYNLADTFASDHNPITNITCSTINNDIDANVVNEQFNLNDVFEYFNGEVDKTRFEDSDSNDGSCNVVGEAEVEKKIVIGKNLPKEKPVRSARPKRVTLESKSKENSSSESERETFTFKRPTALPLRRKIIAAAKKPDGKLTTGNDVAIGNRLNRTMNDALAKQTQRYSSASTLTLHGSDSETVAKRDTGADDATSYVAPNVNEKISFFNQTISERSTSQAMSATPASSATPFAPSASEVEDHQFQRQKSKRSFQQNCEFFEKTLSESFAGGTEQANDRTSSAPKAQILTPDESTDKLEAVEAYVQTKRLFERIQELIEAISNIDEAQMEKLDLAKLKKLLLFIRDCSYKCNQVCFEISENFLIDFEKSVGSAEELLLQKVKSICRRNVQI